MVSTPRLYSLAALAVLSLACGGSFQTQVKGTGTVPGNPNPLGQVLTQFPGFSNFGNVDFAQNEDVKNSKVARDHITSVVATQVTVQITDPSTQDFSFLDSLTFTANTDGQPGVTVAQKTGIASLGLAAPRPTLDLDATGAELRPYALADSMAIGISGSGRPPQTDTTLEAVVTLEVHFRSF